MDSPLWKKSRNTEEGSAAAPFLLYIGLPLF